jgi:hypothetical protein
LSYFTTGKRAAAAMDSQPTPIQSSIEPEGALTKGAGRTSAPRTVAAKAKSANASHDNSLLDSTDEGREVFAIKTVADAPGRQCKANADIPGPPTIQELENSHWYELSDKVDNLSADMRNVQTALIGLRHDKHQESALQKDLEESRAMLQDTNKMLEVVRKNWKRAASQLDQLRSRGTGMYQLLDSDLISSVERLRYDIRAFSVQFSGNATEQAENPRVGDLWKKYMLGTTPGSQDYREYLMSSTRRPIVIQSFLWRFLVGEIFEKFCWMPPLQKSTTKLYEALQPGKCYWEGML